MENKLISVIVPAYNSEKTISKCLDSVLNQSYGLLEIIVVNDGSRDNTANIVLDYKNVVLLNKENGGLCSARNYGLKHAKGDYVVFIDSDDFIEKDFILKLFEKTSGKDDELVMCDFLMDGQKEHEDFGYLEVEGKECIYNLYLHGGIYNRTVNKIYPKKMIEKVAFPEGRDMLEDSYFTSHILEHCNKIIRIPYAGYNYIRHNDSLSKKKHNKFGVASKHSNILEKDIKLSIYISRSEYNFFSSIALEHIVNCFNGCADLNLYNIGDKIITLSTFFYNNTENINDRRVLNFIKCFQKTNKVKYLKKRFANFSLLYDKWTNKLWYFRSLIRKMIKGY